MARIVFETEKFLIEEKGNGWYVLTIKKTGATKTLRLKKDDAKRMLKEIEHSLDRFHYWWG